MAGYFGSAIGGLMEGFGQGLTYAQRLRLMQQQQQDRERIMAAQEQAGNLIAQQYARPPVQQQAPVPAPPQPGPPLGVSPTPAPIGGQAPTQPPGAPMPRTAPMGPQGAAPIPPQGPAPIPPYQPMPTGVAPQQPQEAVPPPPQHPQMTFENVASGLVAQGLKGRQLFDALQQIAPMMGMEYKQQIAELNQLLRVQQAQLAGRKEERAVSTEKKREEQTAERINIEKERVRIAKEKAAQTAAADVDPSSLKATGAMISTGMPISQAVPGFAKSAVVIREKAKAEAIRQIMAETGVTEEQAGKELANRQIDYIAGRRSITQLNTMLGATRQAISQLDFNVDQVTKIIKDLPSTDLSPIINGIIRGEERWTGDPKYASLYFYMHAAAMESARILQGGQASIAQLHQGAAEEAKKWADINLTPAMWGEVSKAMKAEGQNRLKNYQEAMKAQRVGTKETTQGPSKGDVVKGYRFKGGDPSKQENWEKV